MKLILALLYAAAILMPGAKQKVCNSANQKPAQQICLNDKGTEKERKEALISAPSRQKEQPVAKNDNVINKYTLPMILVIE